MGKIVFNHWAFGRFKKGELGEWLDSGTGDLILPGQWRTRGDFPVLSCAIAARRIYIGASFDPSYPLGYITG